MSEESSSVGRVEAALLAVAVLGLVAGAVCWAIDRTGAADAIWALAAGVGLVASLWWVLVAARQGRLGVDVIAVLALGGSLLVGEYLAGALITLMLATGRVIEARADGPGPARVAHPGRTRAP